MGSFCSFYAETQAKAAFISPHPQVGSSCSGLTAVARMLASQFQWVPGLHPVTARGESRAGAGAHSRSFFSVGDISRS